MKRDEHLATLQTLGISSAAAYREAAFSRNIGLFSPGEQERLAEARVAIPGMGGVGGVHLINLVRTGIGRFHLADFDQFEPVNVNRQFGAKVPSFGRPKLAVMIEEAHSINPFLDITPYPAGLTADNMEAFLTDVDVVLDGLDFFQFEIRRTLFNMARSMGVPVITAGPLGYSSALLVFTPQGMGFDDYFDVGGKLPEEQKYLRFAMGLAPRPTHIGYMDLSRVDLKGGKGPSLNIACQLCSSLAATEAVRIILGKPGLRPAPCFLQFDPFRQVLRKGRLSRGNRTFSQRAKLWYVQNVLIKATDQARVRIPDPPVVSVAHFDSLPQGVGTYLLQAAVQAPSGDNVQPWQFRLAGNDIHVFLDPEADVSFSMSARPPPSSPAGQQWKTSAWPPQPWAWMRPRKSGRMPRKKICWPPCAFSQAITQQTRWPGTSGRAAPTAARTASGLCRSGCTTTSKPASAACPKRTSTF